VSIGDDRRELDEYNSGLERRKRLEREIREAGDNDTATLDRELRLLNQRLAQLEKEGIVLRQRVQAAEALRDVYKQLDQTFENQQLVADQTLLVMKDQLAVAEWRVQNDMTLNTQQRQAQIDRAKALEEDIVRQELLVDRQNKYSVSLADSVKSAQELGNSFGDTIAVYERSKTFNVANMIKWTEALRGGTTSIGQLFRKGIQAGITGFIDTLISLMIKMNETETAFQRATGASDDFTRRMTEGYERMRGNTVTIEQNQQAWTALRMTMTDFTMISESAQDQLADTVSVLNNLGVSAETSVKAMQSAAVALNLGGAAAGKAVIELEGYARELGVAPTQLIEQYGTMAGSLAKLGQNGTRAFKDLARVSKITGIEMQKLLNMTDKFDTFEGAAEQAGKLNAALGTNAVNAMDLLMETDPAARFGMIRDSILDAGLSFDTMSYYQRKFFADAAGLESVGDLAAVMRGDMEGLGGEIGKTAQDYEEMANRAREVSTIKEKLTAVLMKMIPIFMPLIDSLDEMLTAFLGNKGAISDFKDSIEEMMPTAQEIIEGLKTLGGMIQFVAEHWEIIALMWVATATGVLPLLGKGLMLTIAKLGSLAVSERAAGAAGAAGATGLGTFALGVLGIGVGIGVAAAGIGFLISSFKELQGLAFGDIAKGFAAVAVSIGILAGAMALMGSNPAVLAGAGALAGLGVAAGGIGLLMGAFKKDKDEMGNMQEIFDSFGNVTGEKLDRGVAAFAQIKDSINEISGLKIAALASVSVAAATVLPAAMAGAVVGGAVVGAREGVTNQKVDVNIEFSETAGRLFVADVNNQGALNFLQGGGGQ